MRARRKERCLRRSGCKADLTQRPAHDRGHQSDFGLAPMRWVTRNKLRKGPRAPRTSASRKLTASSARFPATSLGVEVLKTVALFCGAGLFVWLSDVLQRMTDGHPAKPLDGLLPWNWQPVSVKA
jgi:hypothetical protein